MLNFGPSDQPAMDRRLRQKFKSLANPTKRASTWLKKHPMECLIWATEKAQEGKRKMHGMHGSWSFEQRKAVSQRGCQL